MDDHCSISDAAILSTEELRLIKEKLGNLNKLAFAVTLKQYEFEKQFPRNNYLPDDELVCCISNQLNIPADILKNYNWDISRSAKRFRSDVRKLSGFRGATTTDGENLIEWLVVNIMPCNASYIQTVEHARRFFNDNKIEICSDKCLKRYIKSAKSQFEKLFFEKINNGLSQNSKDIIDELIITGNLSGKGSKSKISNKIIDLAALKKDIPGARLKHVDFAIEKLNIIRQIILSKEAVENIPRKLLHKYYNRIMASSPSHIHEYGTSARYATMAIFCYLRSQIMTDNLTDMMLKLIHKIRTSAESYVNRKILFEVRRVNGKYDILYSLASTALENPTGVIQDKIYPVVDRSTLTDLLVDLKQRGKWYQEQVQLKMRSLYSHASRKLLLSLLGTFELKIDNCSDDEILYATQFVLKNQTETGAEYPNTAEPPIDGAVLGQWKSMVVLKSVNSNNDVGINRLNYEVAILTQLRSMLRYKAVWVEGAYRYRDPNKDLPKDFEARRDFYYHMLNLPQDVNEFISKLKYNLRTKLKELNHNIPGNDLVEILKKNNGHIKLSPSVAQEEPTNLIKIQREITRRWSSVNLLDVLKETELNIGFTKELETAGSRGGINENSLRRRLLLCLYAIGSNTGLKRISAANGEENHEDLRYVKSRYLNSANVRNAIVQVINEVLAIRDPEIWGEATTAVASDSTKVSAWDQNLMSEWHSRYRGRGVMIYWHVDKRSLCIHSQLKNCSSSEVGSMIKGVLEHNTKMALNKAYVDTHGQSTIGFSFSHLLGFELLPRLKNIHKQKLYYVTDADKDSYNNLTPILKSSINWKLIEDYYDEVVKYVVALRTGTVEPDVLIKRFSKDNYKHPIYKALCEIGKATKTIFLCNYLMSEELRIEINDGLNVVERLNGIMGFIFYGKLGEISTNKIPDQELSVLCLHLLQTCLVYINTLLIQQVLSEPAWRNMGIYADSRNNAYLANF